MTTEERLSKLELQLRSTRKRIYWLLIAFLFVVGGLVLPSILQRTAIRAQAQQTVISAYKFNILDNNGTVRGYLGMGPYGPALFLMNVFNQASVIVASEAAGPRIDLCNDSGQIIWRAVR